MMSSVVRTDPHRARGPLHALDPQSSPTRPSWRPSPRSDSEAASAFVRRFERRLFGLALTIVGESRAAEDVAQEALLARGVTRTPTTRGGEASWAGY